MGTYLQAMLKAAQMTSRNFAGGDLPPPYTPPTSGWYMAPPPAYTANPAGYQVPVPYPVLVGTVE